MTPVRAYTAGYISRHELLAIAMHDAHRKLERRRKDEEAALAADTERQLARQQLDTK